jgi:hypothetical protein
MREFEWRLNRKLDIKHAIELVNDGPVAHLTRRTSRTSSPYLSSEPAPGGNLRTKVEVNSGKTIPKDLTFTANPAPFSEAAHQKIAIPNSLTFSASRDKSQLNHIDNSIIQFIVD